METNKIEKVNFTKLEQEVVELLRKHCNNNENKELENDLFTLISSIQEQRSKLDDIKSLAFELANKI